MLGKHRFRVGQRVRPSQLAIEKTLFAKTRHAATGIVTKVNEFNCPTVLWEYRKTTASYHPDFIALDRRRKR